MINFYVEEVRDGGKVRGSTPMNVDQSLARTYMTATRENERRCFSLDTLRRASGIREHDTTDGMLQILDVTPQVDQQLQVLLISCLPREAPAKIFIVNPSWRTDIAASSREIGDGEVRSLLAEWRARRGALMQAALVEEEKYRERAQAFHVQARDLRSLTL